MGSGGTSPAGTEMQHGLASAKSPALGAGGANKGPWTKEEDEMLIQLVNECGTKQWSVVASHLKVRRAAPLPAQPGSLLLLRFMSRKQS